MPRVCSFTGKRVISGHHVSHSNIKTKRRFKPNLQTTSLYSEALSKMVRMRISTAGIRTVEHNGGLDSFLLGTPDRKLGLEALRIKRQILDAKKGETAAA
ncbi:large subunit ribosomal protein L28 [Tistlia consotensis]|uniref:Large ribosomal subunit protein bL28 n=1 Tax=Tistlia consotensis USBA 355 TaxID=560819 RepID=A0A1Y6C6J2_9PROT|nr:50S ribosomal protein L28 [Tistlia consotensis]SMF39403.1 large subunit ribosomal protein L28 [Tistlia consotensis USBA 355]SNR36406.1 large subunit ribosomal protein L28 [Tistlia consotensis]